MVLTVTEAISLSEEVGKWHQNEQGQFEEQKHMVLTFLLQEKTSASVKK